MNTMKARNQRLSETSKRSSTRAASLVPNAFDDESFAPGHSPSPHLDRATGVLLAPRVDSSLTRSMTAKEVRWVR